MTGGINGFRYFLDLGPKRGHAIFRPSWMAHLLGLEGACFDVHLVRAEPGGAGQP